MAKKIKRKKIVHTCMVCDRVVPHQYFMKLPEKEWYVCMDCWIYINKIRGEEIEPKKI